MTKSWKNDGLIGLWGHTFDAYGDIDSQFEILRRTADAYIVRTYSFVDGRPSGLMTITRRHLLGLKLYETCDEMNDALEANQRSRMWRQHQPIELPQGRLQ
jgi:hypothetical protein